LSALEAVSLVFNEIKQRNKISIEHSVGVTLSYSDTYPADFQHYVLLISWYCTL